MVNIIELAREARIEDSPFGAPRYGREMSFFKEELERFAALVRAAVLEEAAQKCDDLWQDDGTAYDCREAIRALKEKK